MNRTTVIPRAPEPSIKKKKKPHEETKLTHQLSYYCDKEKLRMYVSLNHTIDMDQVPRLHNGSKVKMAFALIKHNGVAWAKRLLQEELDARGDVYTDPARFVHGSTTIVRR